jgi:hypothetical protein
VGRRIPFTLGFPFDDQFEHDYYLPPVNEKTPREYRLRRYDTPTFEETLQHIIEVVARYVGRSMRAVPVTFINDVIRFLICEHRRLFILSPREQRLAVAVAGARMLNISDQAISAATLSGNVDDRNKPDIPGVWLMPTSDIIAFDGAGLSFKHYPLIEELLMSNRNISNPFPYISSFLYFYGIGSNVAGRLFSRLQTVV